MIITIITTIVVGFFGLFGFLIMSHVVLPPLGFGHAFSTFERPGTNSLCICLDFSKVGCLQLIRSIIHVRNRNRNNRVR